jgi:flagellar biosynthesis/type III secretory pathway chaperone
MTVTGSVAGDLLAVLDAQADVSEQLLQLAEARRAALVAAEADRLADLLDQEQPLLTRLRRLEAARLQLIRPLAEQLGVMPAQATVSDLCAIVDPETAIALQAAKERLLATITHLNAANETNSAFLQACLDSVNASIQHLLRAVQLDPRYASSGSRAARETVSRLTDFRA